MVLSMTGFASTTATLTLADGSQINILINMKTLNSRFFETTCKLSYTLGHLETKLIRALKAKLLRGHTYLTMHVQNPQALKGSVQPSVAIIEGYVQAIDQIKKKVAIEGTVTVSDLLRLPDVFETEEKTIDKGFEKQLFQIIDQLIQQVIETRVQEGTVLERDLRERFATMKKEIEEIEKAASNLIQKKKEEIAQAMREIEQQESESSEARIGTLYIALDKMDIHEEIVRFKSHLANIIKQLDAENPEKGKRLDFTLQELAREINTLSSKCSNAAISTQAINVKVELEKSREQTQNIV